jgi:adenylate cyclase
LDDPGRALGEEKKIAILFSDIEGYTPFAEALPPYDVIHVLNRYYQLMGEIVERHHGHISDYAGDGMLTLYGLSSPDTAVRDALQAGQEMLHALNRLNPYLKHMYDRTFNIRLGLHYGEVIVGDIGVEKARKLAAVGDAVNMASRIESTNKQFGTHFLVSETVVEAAGSGLVTSRHCYTTLKGKKGEYQLFEVKELRFSDEA